MAKQRIVRERELAEVAKEVRLKAGKRKAEVAEAMGVSPPTMHHVEESPERSLTKLRLRIIGEYSRYRAEGPFYRLEMKKREEL